MKPALQPSVAVFWCRDCCYWKRSKLRVGWGTCIKPKLVPDCTAGMVYKRKEKR